MVTEVTRHSSVLSLLLMYLCVEISFGYLDQNEINSINSLYNEWNGESWSDCTWNITKINNTNKNNYLTSQCHVSNTIIFGNYSNITKYQYVSAIRLNNVTGTIPPSIANLSKLQKLLLYSDLFGTIGSFMCNLTQLTSFYINSVNMNGMIPSCMFDLPNIKEFAFIDTPSLSLQSSNIEQLCRNINIQNSLNTLFIENVNYIGTIPSCIGTHLSQLQYLRLESINFNQLNATIPSSINNLTNLFDISLYNLSNISEKTFINLKTFKKIAGISLDFSIIEANLSDLCHMNVDTITIYNDDQNNMIPLPTHCIFGKNNSLDGLEINGAGFSGSIGNALCSQVYSLEFLYISNTKFVEINIPKCLNSDFDLTRIKLINNTHLHSIGKHAFGCTYMEFLQIQNNPNLGGKISDLLPVEYRPADLTIFAVDNNNFYEEHIDELFKRLFVKYSKLMVLTLHGNKYVSGTIETNISGEDVYMDNLQVLTLHGLDIYGTIPHNIHFANNVSINETKIYTFFNNRFSGTIPPNLFNIKEEEQYFKPIFLLGNKFKVFNEGKNSMWLKNNSLFISASNLYISFENMMMSYVMTFVGFVAAVVIIVTMIINRMKCCCGKNNKVQNMFLFNLQKINDILYDKWVLILVLVLMLFYKFNSNYYQQNTFLSTFSLYNFYSTNRYVNAALYMLVFLFNISMVCKVAQINNNKNAFKYCQIGMNEYSVNSVNVYNDRSYNVYNSNVSHPKLNFGFYLIMYLFVIILVFFYGLFVSLPSDNVFGIDSYFSLKLITTPLAVILSLTKSMVVPNLVIFIFQIFHIDYKYRNNFIMFLRTFLMVIIPFISNMFWINECGNGWTRLWSNCSAGRESRFNLEATITYISPENDFLHNPQFHFIDLLTAEEVCKTDLTSINVSKCFREFYSLWTNILFESMTIMFFMPMLIIILKLLKHKLLRPNYKYLSIDSEYLMITSKLEICFIFGLVCPLLLPLSFCALKWNEIFYKLLINKFKIRWTIRFAYNNNIPVVYLYFSLMVLHLFSFIFMFYYESFEFKSNMVLCIVFCLSLALIYWIIFCYGRYRDNRSQQRKSAINIVDSSANEALNDNFTEVTEATEEQLLSAMQNNK
eukprot:273856_1